MTRLSSAMSAVQQALSESDRRFSALVSSMPGLVFQLQSPAAGNYTFTYLSDGCEALLGLSVLQLLADSNLFFAAMETEARDELLRQLQTSVKKQQRLDWEGRVWIDAWQDMKWINLRASVRVLADGVVQWDGIMLNITQSKREKHEIEQAKRDLQALTAHMNHIKEQERISIAREIHDDLGGNLTAMKLALSTMVQQIGKGEAIRLEQTNMLQTIIDQTFEAVHRISGNLRPNILDLGLVDALDWQVSQFRKQLGIACKYSTNCQELQLDSESSMALFRICQEALSNIAKYAQATQIEVSLLLQDKQLILSVKDNGIGIKPVDKIKGNAFGLRGMQERMAALHGQLMIEPLRTDGGTIVQASISLS